VFSHLSRFAAIGDVVNPSRRLRKGNRTLSLSLSLVFFCKESVQSFGSFEVGVAFSGFRDCRVAIAIVG